MSIALLLLAAVAQQEPSPHEQKNFDVRGRALFPLLSGDFSATDNGIEGQTIDLEGDLDIEPATLGGELEISATVIPWLTIRAHYWQTGFNGSDTIDTGFFFGGSFYGAGSRVDTDFDIRVFSLLAEYNLVLYDTPDFRFELGVQGGFELVAFDAELRNATAATPFTERQRFTAPLPILGVRARVEFLDLIAVEGWIHGLAMAGLQDARSLVLEGALEVQVTIFSGLFVGAGVHFLSASVELEPTSDEEAEFDVMIAGPFVSAGWRF